MKYYFWLGEDTWYPYEKAPKRAHDGVDVLREEARKEGYKDGWAQGHKDVWREYYRNIMLKAFW